MAVRKISTVLAVEGESGYKNAIANINRELKSLTSALELSSSEFSSNANSMDAIRAKGEALNALYTKQTTKIEEISKAMANAQAAYDKYDTKQKEISAALEANAAAMAAVNKSSAGASDETARLKEEQKELKEALLTANASMAAAEAGALNWQTKLNGAKVELNDLDAEIKQNNTYLSEAENSTDGLATSIDQYGNKVKQAGQNTEEFSQKSRDGINALADVLIAAGLQRTFNELASALKECTDASINFESAITGVYKTVSGTPEQLQAISDGIKEMALRLPMTTAELAAIAEVAGQFKIETDNILSFTETIADLANTTNMSSEQAASSLSKFMNITKTAQTEVSRLGSVVVALGNNSTTTESDIMRMGMNIVAAGTQIGLSESQILGYSAALSSLGLEAEAGGSAFSTAVKQIQLAVETGSEDLNKFAEVAGMTGEAFKTLWKNDITSAITAFINGLGGVNDASESTIAMLDEIGFSGIRVSDAWTRLSSNSALVENALDTANVAWEENVALTNEANLRYETTESKIILMQNAFNNLKIAIGDQLKPALEAAVTGLTGISEAMAEWAQANEWVGPAIAAVTVFIGTLTTLTVVIKGVTAAWTVMTGVMAIGGGAVGAVVIALGALAAAAAAVVIAINNTHDAFAYTAESAEEFVEALKKAEEAYKETAQALTHNDIAVGNLLEKLEKLLSVENKSAAQKLEIAATVDLLNIRLPELALSYDEVTDSINLSIEAMHRLSLELLYQDKLEAAQARYAELFDKQQQLLNGYKNEAGEWQDGINDLEILITKQQGVISRLIEQRQKITEEDSEGWKANYAAVKDAQKQLDEYTVTLKSLNEAYDENQKQIESVDHEVEGYFKNIQDITDATDDYSDSVDSMGAAIEGATELSEAAKEQLKAAAKELENIISETNAVYEEKVALIDDYADAVYEALRNQAQEQYDLTVENNNRLLEAEREASSARVELIQEEYDERIRIMNEAANALVENIQSQIDAIKAAAEAEDAAAALSAYNDKISGYNAGIGKASGAVSALGGGYASTVAEYQAKNAELAQEYADKITAAEAEKAEAMKKTQDEISDLEKKYKILIAEAGTDTEKIAELKNKQVQEVSELNARLIAEEYGYQEKILKLKKAQNEAEYQLAQERADKLTEIANAQNETAKKTALKAVDDLNDIESKKNDAIKKYQDDQIEENRKEQVKALEKLQKEVTKSAKELETTYKENLQAQKDHEADLLKDTEEHYAKVNEKAKEQFDLTVENTNLRNATLKTLQTASNDDIIALLEAYNPQWAAAGQGWTDQLANGVRTTREKVTEAIGETLDDAMATLDTIMQQLINYNDMLRQIKMELGEAVQPYVQRGFDAGFNIALAMLDGTEAGARKGLNALGVLGADIINRIVDSMKETGVIHSPSEVTKEIGVNLGEAVGIGLISTKDANVAAAGEIVDGVTDELSKLNGLTFAQGSDGYAKIEAMIAAQEAQKRKEAGLLEMIGFSSDSYIADASDALKLAEGTHTTILEAADEIAAASADIADSFTLFAMSLREMFSLIPTAVSGKIAGANISTTTQKLYNNNPTINFNQPVKSPYEAARAVKQTMRQLIYGH